MDKCIVSAVIGFVAGVYIGYIKEDEIDDMCHQSKKAKRKMKKKYHKTMHHICDCMD